MGLNTGKSPRTRSSGQHEPPAPFVGALFHLNGARLYLTATERKAFLDVAEKASPEVRTFASLLHYTGCRLSEALELTRARVRVAEGVVVFESLKKRRRGIYRAVPVPSTLLRLMEEVHGPFDPMERATDERLWPWSRTTGWRHIKQIMARAGIAGYQASPKGLRHGFGVAALEHGVPINLVQRWLGHADIATTAIYLNAVGEEEQRIAARMWG